MSNVHRMTSCTITWEPIFLPEDLVLSKKDQAIYEKAYGQLRKFPQKTIPIFESLIAKYPKVPRLFNNLSSAYLFLGDTTKADEITAQISIQFPDYLFGKISKAEACLRRGDLEQIPEIFNQKYDLTLVCPGRDVFHGSEAIGFAGIMGEYFARIGKLDTARLYLKILETVDPDHPITGSVGFLIVMEASRQVFEKMVGRSKNRRQKSSAK